MGEEVVRDPRWRNVEFLRETVTIGTKDHVVQKITLRVLYLGIVYSIGRYLEPTFLEDGVSDQVVYGMVLPFMIEEIDKEMLRHETDAANT